MKEKKYNFLTIVTLCFIGSFFLLILKPHQVHSEAAGEDSVWVVDSATKSVVRKLSYNGARELFRIEGSNLVSDVDFDPRDASFWVTVKGDSSLLRYSADGKTKIVELEHAFCTPVRSALDIKNNVIWTESWTQGELIKYSLEGKQLLRMQGLSSHPFEIVISPFDASIWVGDQGAGKFIRFSTDGRMLGFTERRLGEPLYIAINPKDGSAWTTFQGPGRIVKFSADGKILALLDGFGLVQGVTINPQDGSAWVADTTKGELIHVSFAGEILDKIGGFPNCYQLSVVDPDSKSFWVTDSVKGEIIRVSVDGKILQKSVIGGFPVFVQAYKGNTAKK